MQNKAWHWDHSLMQVACGIAARPQTVQFSILVTEPTSPLHWERGWGLWHWLHSCRNLHDLPCLQSPLYLLYLMHMGVEWDWLMLCQLMKNGYDKGLRPLRSWRGANRQSLILWCRSYSMRALCPASETQSINTQFHLWPIPLTDFSHVAAITCRRLPKMAT